MLTSTSASGQIRMAGCPHGVCFTLITGHPARAITGPLSATSGRRARRNAGERFLPAKAIEEKAASVAHLVALGESSCGR